MNLVVIAQTGPRFGDFAPYVPAVNDHGVVAFQATLTDGSSGVFTGSGEDIVDVVGDHAGDGAVTSHPDISRDGSTCFYSELQGRSRVVLVVDGDAHTIADSAGELERIGPLGPTMNDAGVVAFRATTRAGVGAVCTGDHNGASTIATIGEQFSAFDGLPVINAAGAVVFRADQRAGGQGIYLRDERGITTVADTSDCFDQLARFPVINDAGTVAFCAKLVAGGEGVFMVTDSEVACAVDTRDAFESFRGALIDSAGTLVFYATPRGGKLGIYIGPDPDADKILGIGDAMFGSVVSAFVLNPVSVNDVHQLAIRIELSDGRQMIVRVDIS